ncbi:putative leucine-rich repeat-containing, plant-type, leucine-rich repeat domain superfamily [Arabidopsis thaliana]
MHSCSERRMMTVIWSLCLIFCLSNSILAIAKDLCLPDQRDALLEFKNEFYVQEFDPHMKCEKATETWRNKTDCCSWNRVSCDPKTGKVTTTSPELELSSNNISGILPDSIGNLKYLRSLSFRTCNLFGKIPSSLGSLSYLTHLDLSYNDFTSEGPDSGGNLNRLTDLQLVLLNLSSVTWIDLGSNQLKGRGIVDFSIFLHLKSLCSLDLSYLNTRSMVDLSFFSHLMSLDELDLSGINLKISSTLSFPSATGTLILASCNIVEFPKFLENQTSLFYLDISANHNEGQVPEWLWRLPTLSFVNIAQNSFSGELPMLPNSIYSFIASDNQFSGEIPRTVCELVSLNTLVLSNNKFSGSIPRCFDNFKTISILHLRNNSLSGFFPKEIISETLTSLDVGHNWLSGQLPKSLIKCTDLEFLNVEDNRINDKFPFWLRSLSNLQILVLRSNEFHGPISSLEDSLSFPKLRIFDISENRFTGVLPSDYFAGWSAMSSVVDIFDTTPQVHILGVFQGYYHNSVVLTNKGLNMELVGSGFTIYKTIDVSGNRLEGDIPESIGTLKELIVLNMSNNAFTGHIPPSLSNLSNLQSLDLSQNRLSGSIPPELGKLTFLEWMNFSYNRLEGPIPQATQIQSQNSSSFAENPGLCGAPLLNKCGGEEEATKQEEDEDEEKEEKDQVFSWIAAAIGYVPGVFCGLTIAHILTS